jgi:hypothetical protein
MSQITDQSHPHTEEFLFSLGSTTHELNKLSNHLFFKHLNFSLNNCESYNCLTVQLLQLIQQLQNCKGNMSAVHNENALMLYT